MLAVTARHRVSIVSATMLMDSVPEEKDSLGARMTIGIQGSLGILHYALLAFRLTSPAPHSQEPRVHHGSWLTKDLLERGFRPACNADYEDMVLKAQPADGSVRCHASTNGLISLHLDDEPVWARQYDPNDPETALWIKAAQAREVTVIGGDNLQISNEDIDVRTAASKGSLVTAKVPTVWIGQPS